MSEPSPSPHHSRKVVDWEAIRTLYRLGRKSNREIAREFFVNEKTIRLRAAKEGWERDLYAKVAAGIRQALVHSYSAEPTESAKSAETAKIEDRLVGAEIENGRAVIMKHQRIGVKLSSTAERLADIVGQQLEVAETITAKDLNLIAGANSRATASAQMAIGIERQAQNLDVVATDPNAPTAIHITYYRDTTVQNLKIGGNGGGDGRR